MAKPKPDQRLPKTQRKEYLSGWAKAEKFIKKLKKRDRK